MYLLRGVNYIKINKCALSLNRHVVRSTTLQSLMLCLILTGFNWVSGFSLCVLYTIYVYTIIHICQNNFSFILDTKVLMYCMFVISCIYSCSSKHITYLYLGVLVFCYQMLGIIACVSLKSRIMYTYDLKLVIFCKIICKNMFYDLIM